MGIIDDLASDGTKWGPYEKLVEAAKSLSDRAYQIDLLAHCLGVACREGGPLHGLGIRWNAREDSYQNIANVINELAVLAMAQQEKT